MRIPKLTAGLALVFVLAAAGIALAEDDAPSITLDYPLDEEWFIEPAVTLEGTVGTTPLSRAFNMSVLGMADGTGTVVEDGKAVYRVRPYFVDEFTGSTLDTDMWNVLGSTDNCWVQNGTLVIGTGGINSMPLVHSRGSAFPEDMDVPWIAEWRMRYSIAGTFYNVAGGGMTSSGYSADGSHVATWKEHFVQGYRVYVNGNAVRTYGGEATSWNTYALHYDPDDNSYTVYLDGSYLTTFSKAGAPSEFWFGCPQYGTKTIYPSVSVDYARLWTFEASWESETVDMGGSVLVTDARYSWSTNAPGVGTITVQMAASEDGTEWTGWTDITRGRSPPILEGRFLRFRADMAVPFVKDTSKRVTLSSITIDHQYRLTSLEYDHNGAGWMSMEINTSWTLDLDLVEDLNHIEVRVTDSLGLTNSTSVDLVLDTTLPTGTLEIDGGAELTSSLDVVLALSAQDTYGVPTMHVSLHPLFKTFRSFDFNETLAYTLEGVDGPITVYVRFVDSHGLISAVVSDTITLDMTPPESSCVINAGSEHSPTDLVTLTLTHEDANGVVSVEVSNDEAFTGATTVPVEDLEVAWDLEVEADGVAWVYVRVTDAVGNSVVVSDSIDVYIPKAEGSVTVKGTALTNQPLVTLEIDVPTHLRATFMQVSEDPTFDGVKQQEVSDTLIWILSPGDGDKTVYVRFEDYRGFSSLPVSAQVTVDSTEPVVTAVIDDGAGYATETRVTLSLTFADDHEAAGLWVGDTDDRVDATGLVWAPTIEWTLPAQEGERTVHVWAADGAGNVGYATCSIILATTAPSLTVSVPGTTNADDLPVDLQVLDAIGGVQVQVAIDGDPSDLDAWVDAEDMEVDISELPEGDHVVHARARNAAGLMSQVATDAFTVDRTAPGLTILSPVDGKVTSPSKLALEVDAAEGTVEYRIDGGEWTTMTGTVTDLDVEEGEHTVEVRVTDGAGNVATSSATFEVKGGESPGPSMVLAVAALCSVLVILGRRRG